VALAIFGIVSLVSRTPLVPKHGFGQVAERRIHDRERNPHLPGGIPQPDPAGSAVGLSTGLC
jgi:hypothetical protein